MSGQVATAVGDARTTVQGKGKGNNRNKANKSKKATQFQPGRNSMKQAKPHSTSPTKNGGQKRNTQNVNVNPASTWDINPTSTWNVNPVSAWDVNPASAWDVNPTTWDAKGNVDPPAVNPTSTWDINPGPRDAQATTTTVRIAPINHSWGLEGDDIPPVNINVPETPKEEEWVVRDPNGPWELTELIVNTYCNAVEDWENTKARTAKEYHTLWRQDRVLSWVLTGTEEETVPNLRGKGVKRLWKPFSASRPAYEW